MSLTIESVNAEQILLREASLACISDNCDSNGANFDEKLLLLDATDALKQQEIYSNSLFIPPPPPPPEEE